MSTCRPGPRTGFRNDRAPGATTTRSDIVQTLQALAVCLASLLIAPLACAAEEPAAGISPGPAPGCEALAHSQSSLASRLIQAIAKAGPGPARTIVVSPASLAATLAAIEPGAEPALRKAMLDTLQLPATGDEAKRGFDCIRSAMAQLRDSEGAVRTADTLVFSQIAAPSPEIGAAFAAAGVPIVTEDLSKADALARINSWVKDKTAGLISSLIDAPLSQPGLVALNAMHFKAPWSSRFEAKGTRRGTFTAPGVKPVTVQMMHLPQDRRAFRREAGLIAVELPFRSERFVMTIVTTDGPPAEAARLANAGDWLAGAGFEDRRGDLLLPRLSLSFRGDLIRGLDALGLAQARTSANALAGFGPGLSLDHVIQRVEVRADEEGAEAAAATAAITTRSFEGKPLHMVIDKPFLFAIRDRQTSLVLVAGFVMDPTGP